MSIKVKPNNTHVRLPYKSGCGKNTENSRVAGTCELLSVKFEKRIKQITIQINDRRETDRPPSQLVFTNQLTLLGGGNLLPSSALAWPEY